MNAARFLAASAFGLALAATPFLRYLHPDLESERHADHHPHHGGVLQMVGDHHIEVRRRHGAIDVFVTDAFRQPVEARMAWVILDGSERRRLLRRGGHFTAPDEDAGARLTVEVEIAPDLRLTWDDARAADAR